VDGRNPDREDGIGQKKTGKKKRKCHIINENVLVIWHLFVVRHL